MWKFGLKSGVKVDSKKGDSIKNSNITIHSQSDSVITEIYRIVGKLEGSMSAVKSDVKYIRSKFEELDDRVDALEHTIFRNAK